MYRREIKITAKEAAKQAGKAAKLATLVFLLIQLGLNGLQLLTNFLTSRTSGGGSISDALAADARNKAIVYIIMVIVGIVGVLLNIGYTRIALQVHRREPVPMESLLEGFQIPGRAIGLRLFRALLMLMWTYALLIPAIILLSFPITPLDRMMESDTWFVMYMVVLMIVAVAVSTAVSYRYWGATFILLDHPDYTVYNLPCSLGSILTIFQQIFLDHMLIRPPYIDVFHIPGFQLFCHLFHHKFIIRCT